MAGGRKRPFGFAPRVGVVTLLLGVHPVVHAAINPASPGLAPAEAFGEEGIPNNAASALCVECHTENPRVGGGTHFVLHAVTGFLRRTHSGGGWEKGAWGVREGGEFFKLTPWIEEEWGNGGVSKYGDLDSWESVVYAGGGEPLLGAEAARQETAAASMAGLEMICESCHSVRVNIGGRWNLLANPGSTPVVGDYLEGGISPLCVGCHGFLYHDDGGLANYLNSNWNDSRNFSLAAGKRRGNNEVHYIAGITHPRNHHVMTGDVIDVPLAEAGLLVRDTNTLAPSQVSTPIRTDSKKGSMPTRDVVGLPLILPSEPTRLHCLTCHAPGHGGDPTLGASILRGDGLGGRDAGHGIDRIVDGRGWMQFEDRKFCLLCHELKGQQ